MLGTKKVIITHQSLLLLKAGSLCLPFFEVYHPEFPLLPSCLSTTIVSASPVESYHVSPCPTLHIPSMFNHLADIFFHTIPAEGFKMAGTSRPPTPGSD